MYNYFTIQLAPDKPTIRLTNYTINQLYDQPAELCQSIMDNKKVSDHNDVDSFINMCYTSLLPRLLACGKEESYILSIEVLKMLGEEIAKRISTRTVRLDVTILVKEEEKTATSDVATSTLPNDMCAMDTKHGSAPSVDPAIDQPASQPVDLDAKFRSDVSAILDPPVSELEWLKGVNPGLINTLLTNEIHAKSADLKQIAAYYNKFHDILPYYVAKGEDLRLCIENYIIKYDSKETIESIRGFVESLHTDISDRHKFLSGIFKRFPKFIARSIMASIGDYKGVTHDTFDGLVKYTKLETEYNEYAKDYDLPRWELSVVFERVSEQLADYYIKLAIEQPDLFAKYKFDDWPLLKQATLKKLGEMYDVINMRLYSDKTAKALYKVFGVDVIRVFAKTRHMYAIIAALSE